MHGDQDIIKSWDHNLKYHIQEGQIKGERKKYEYINEVYQNGSHQHKRAGHAEKFFYCIDINSSPDSLPNCKLCFGLLW